MSQVSLVAPEGYGILDVAVEDVEVVAVTSPNRSGGSTSRGNSMLAIGGVSNVPIIRHSWASRKA